MSRAAEMDQIYSRIRRDPFALARLLHFDPTPQQAYLLEDICAGYPRISVKSGQGTGKTAVSALIAIWRVIRARNSRVIVTAPSMRQCQEVWMVEARNLVHKGPDWFRRDFHFTSRKIYFGSSGKDDESRPEWGVQCVTATNPVNAQGYHGDTLSFIVEEASGVPRPIIEQIEGTLSQPTGDLLHLQIGNPNTRDCAFYDTFHGKRKHWRCHTFNAEDSPRVDPKHCAYLKEVYGENSDVVRVRVYGEFPKMDPNAVMAMEDLEACTRTDQMEMAFASEFKQFGIDLARFGSDESVTSRVRGNCLFPQLVYAKREPVDVVAEAFVEERRAGWGPEDGVLYVADADGLGQGVMVNFTRAGKRLLEFRTSGRPFDASIFADRMTEAWFTLGRLVKSRKCHIPNDPLLLTQLAGRIYSLDSKGKIKLERKEDYKKRTMQESPDRADSAVMAFYRRPPDKEVRFA